MCGIHGVLASTKRKTSGISTEKYIEEGFVVNALRGMDSSGIFQVDDKGEPFLHKNCVSGPDFIRDDVVRKFVKDASSSSITICHVRAATKGEVNAENAHPFVAYKDNGNRVLGVHNGTLFNSTSHKIGDKTFDVDSEWAINMIAKHGVDAFKEFDGAYCFVWWDEDAPDVIYMARNNDRPMHFLLNASQDVMFFGSEAGMVSWLCERNRVIYENAPSTGKIYNLQPGKMYTFDLSGSQITWSKAELPARRVTSFWSGGNNRNSYRDLDDEHFSMSPYSGYYHGNTYYRDRNPASSAGGGSNEDSFHEDGLEIAETIKAALAANRLDRDKATRKKEGGDENDVPKKISRKERRRQAARARAEAAAAVREGLALTETGDDEVPVTNDNPSDMGYFDSVPDAWFSKASATSVEQATAKSLGLYGELQWFTGSFYEPDTSECFGEIEDYIKGEGKVSYVASVRNVSAQYSDQSLINNKHKGEWVVVIGASGESTGGRHYVVALLNEFGRREMKRMAA